MAWSRERIDNKLLNQFMFFVTGGVNGGISETITGGDVGENENFWIQEVRLHLSVSFASVADFIIKLSEAAKGSAYNIIFFSKAMSGSTDVVWIPSGVNDKGILFDSGDTLNFDLASQSGANTYGLTVIGWAVAS